MSVNPQSRGDGDGPLSTALQFSAQYVQMSAFRRATGPKSGAGGGGRTRGRGSRSGAGRAPPPSGGEEEGPSSSPPSPLASQSSSSRDGTSPSSSSSSPSPVLPAPSSRGVAGPRPSPPLGAVPSSGGRYLTSFGHKELDSILGGGQPLGTAVLVEEDRWTFDLGRSLVRYWCAEAVSQGQTLLLPATRPDVPSALPTSPPSSMDGDGDGLCPSDRTEDRELSSGVIGGSSPSELRSLVVDALPRNLNRDKEERRKREEEEGRTPRAMSGADDNGAGEPPPGAEQRGTLEALAEEEDGDDEEEENGGEVDSDADADADAFDQAQKAEEGLQNAWQYRRSVQEERSGARGAGGAAGGGRRRGRAGGNKKSSAAAVPFCHSYDLGGRMSDQCPEGWPWRDEDGEDGVADSSRPEGDSAWSPGGKIVVEDCCCAIGGRTSTRRAGFELFKRLARCVEAQLSSDEEERGGRSTVATVRLLLLDVPVGPASVALPLLLSRVRARSLPVAVLLTVRAWRCTDISPRGTSSSSSCAPLVRDLAALRRSSDAVLACDSFAALEDSRPPPEFRDLAGILTLTKVALHSGGGSGHFADSVVGRRPPADRYGLSRDRRKLNVKMLHLPPEEFSGVGGGGSVSGGGPRSGGGGGGRSTKAAETKEGRTKGSAVGCGSGGGGASVLDF